MADTTAVPAICFELTQDVYDRLPDEMKETFTDLIGQTVALVGARPIDR